MTHSEAPILKAVRLVGAIVFVAQALLAVTAPTVAVGFDALLTFWTALPHVFLAAAGLVVLRLGNRPAVVIVSVLGVAALVYIGYVYGPSAFGVYPPEGGLEFIVYPVFMWLLALGGIVVCALAAALSAPRAQIRRAS